MFGYGGSEHQTGAGANSDEQERIETEGIAGRKFVKFEGGLCFVPRVSILEAGWHIEQVVGGACGSGD